MDILITGAQGFIAAHLINALRGQHTIYALDFHCPTEERADGVHWIAADLTQTLPLDRLPRTIDAVIHLAQSRFYRQFPERADDIVAVNVTATAQLLEYARQAGAERFLFASTGSVYGSGVGPLEETAPLSLPSFYARSKYAAEVLVSGYSACFRTIIFRFFTVYGPGQRGMLIPTLAQRIQAGETVSIDGNPGLLLSTTYVRDATRAIAAALAYQDSLVVNIAGDEVVSITDLVGMIANTVGQPATIVHKEVPLPGNAIGDNSRMKTALGVFPETTLSDGLRVTLMD